jgi:general secretion pathway protein D
MSRNEKKMMAWGGREVCAGLLVCTSLWLGGCATYFEGRRADRLMAEGHQAEGVQLLGTLADKDPDGYRRKYLSARDTITQKLLLEAQNFRRNGQIDEALSCYRDILLYDPQHADAMHGLALIARDQREAAQLKQARGAVDANDNETARNLLEQILAENPGQREALQLRQSIEIKENQSSLAEPVLKKTLKKPVSLEFRNASIQAVFEVLSQSSGINFIFDPEVKAVVRTTIFARQTSIEDALGLILRTAKLEMKILNDSTVLIYPDTTEKGKQYEDLIMRTFYLNSADPGKINDMIKTLVAPRYTYVDQDKKMLIVRDNMRVIDAVERLIKTNDIPAP